MIDPSLLKLANWKLARKQNKSGFVDPAMAMGGGMPPMGGAPPMDPAMMGGMPPMDPAMMGGMPPMDPAMMGGMPPMPPEAPPAEAAPPADLAAGPKKPKLDPNAIYVEQVRNRKLLLGIYRQLGLKLPDDILNDEDLIAPGVMPKSSKEPPAPEAGPAGLPPVGDSPGVSPIEPAQMAGPSMSELLGAPGTMPG